MKTPGKQRLAKFLLKRHLSKTGLQVQDRSGCIFTLPNIQEPVGFSLYVHGVYEPATIRCIESLLEGGGTFLDIGANIGSITIPVAKRLGDKVRIISAEPSPSVYRFLPENLQSNQINNVTVESCALSDHEGSLDFYVPPQTHFGMGSASPQFGVEPIRVRATTLDQLIHQHAVPSVHVIKMDVEGHTSSHPPVVIFEFCDWAEVRSAHGRAGVSQEILRSWGYRIWTLKNFLKGGSPLREILKSGSTMFVARRGLD